MEKKYRPINCNYHDILLAQATKRVCTEVHYYDEMGKPVSKTSTIKDIYTQKGEEFMKLDGGDVIRLDKIIVVGEHTSPHHLGLSECFCN